MTSPKTINGLAAISEPTQYMMWQYAPGKENHKTIMLSNRMSVIHSIKEEYGVYYIGIYTRPGIGLTGIVTDSGVELPTSDLDKIMICNLARPYDPKSDNYQRK
jgi:hypothetical protein